MYARAMFRRLQRTFGRRRRAVEPRFVYLAQGAFAQLCALPFPAGATVFALCYDDDRPVPAAHATIHDGERK